MRVYSTWKWKSRAEVTRCLHTRPARLRHSTARSPPPPARAQRLACPSVCLHSRTPLRRCRQCSNSPTPSPRAATFSPRTGLLGSGLPASPCPPIPPRRLFCTMHATTNTPRSSTTHLTMPSTRPRAAAPPGPRPRPSPPTSTAQAWPASDGGGDRSYYASAGSPSSSRRS